MSPEDRDNAMLLFWSVYSLDRRWSFGTGMPFALQDSDLDPQLPRPVSPSISHPQHAKSDLLRATNRHI